MKQYFPILMILTIFSAGFSAQTPLTENTLRITVEAKGAPAKASDMGWMNGAWDGNAFGGKVKEVWSVTDGGVMMGMFILVKDNKPAFYEFMTFSVDEGQLFLKLKHFHPGLIGWEEKDKTVDFRFIKREADRFYFNGLTFEKAGADGLNIYLALSQDKKSFNEVVFRLKRSN